MVGDALLFVDDPDKRLFAISLPEGPPEILLDERLDRPDMGSSQYASHQLDGRDRKVDIAESELLFHLSRVAMAHRRVGAHRAAALRMMSRQAGRIAPFR